MLVLVRILCNNNLLQYLHCFNICIFVVEELVFLMASEKMLQKKPKLTISNDILFKCLCNEGKKAIVYDILMFHILFNGGKLHTYTNDVINACLQIIYKGHDSDSSLEGN